ncbi:hypothetical protein E2K99_10305 [Herbaspirillum huttiense]|uniref:hypothetical protein n=1 Tax=Herbaspirillum huttiense TaxID=863372 RepID=UPI001066F92E|nr:hypothetical protein [Herbaspirillum huttiense]QBP75379.1 hypothetical protein E2K99_10305 [Herbaspirillum huttiense]
MFHDTHESPIGSLRRHVETWKKRTGLSNATIAQFIVEAHERIGGPVRTGITFGRSGDAYNDMKAHQQRIWRWLDDVSDDKNLLSANFLPSIVAALPTDLKISFWNELLSHDGFCVASLEEGDGQFRITDLALVMKEDSEAHQACAEVIGSPDDIQALRRAEKEITEAIETKKQARVRIGAMIRAMSAVSKICQPFRRDGATR